MGRPRCKPHMHARRGGCGDCGSRTFTSPSLKAPVALARAFVAPLKLPCHRPSRAVGVRAGPSPARAARGLEPPPTRRASPARRHAGSQQVYQSAVALARRRSRHSTPGEPQSGALSPSSRLRIEARARLAAPSRCSRAASPTAATAASHARPRASLRPRHGDRPPSSRPRPASFLARSSLSTSFPSSTLPQRPHAGGARRPASACVPRAPGPGSTLSRCTSTPAHPLTLEQLGTWPGRRALTASGGPRRRPRLALPRRPGSSAAAPAAEQYRSSAPASSASAGSIGSCPPREHGHPLPALLGGRWLLLQRARHPGAAAAIDLEIERRAQEAAGPRMPKPRKANLEADTYRPLEPLSVVKVTADAACLSSAVGSSFR